MSLSSMETSLCHREARDKEKVSAHGMMEGGKKGSEAPASSLFPLSHERFLLFDYWDTLWEPLRRGELLCAYTVYVQ